MSKILRDIKRIIKLCSKAIKDLEKGKTWKAKKYYKVF